MSHGSIPIWPAVLALLLFACGGSATTQSSNEDGEHHADHAFHPVQTRQPTESGAWVVDPNDPLTLYALGQRTLRSKDGGHTWAELGWPAGAQALLFARKPVPALYLQVRDPKGEDANPLFESLNGGKTWAQVSAATASGLVLVDQDSGPVLLSVSPGGVSRSTDKGATFAAAPLPDLMLLQLGRAFVSSDVSPVVYLEASTFDLEFGLSVFVSTDAGATFVPRAIPGGAQLAVSVPPVLSLDCRGRLYTLFGTTVYRSSDSGTTWQSVATVEPNVLQFRVLPAPLAACSDSVYATGWGQQGTTLWQLDATTGVTSRLTLDGGEVSSLGEDRLLLVTPYELRQRSDDGGRSWWPVGVELELGELVLSRARAGLSFVATTGAVYRTDDAGKSWQGWPAKGTRFLSGLVLDPRDSQVLYASNRSGEASSQSFISRDGGASFEDWPVPTPTAPEFPEALAVSATGRVTVVTDSGVYATDDAGLHFTTVFTLPVHHSLWAAIGGGEPAAIYLALTGVPSSSGSAILASLDGGVTWTSADPGSYVDCLLVHPSDPQVAFGCSHGEGDGLLRTLDGGASWSAIAMPVGEDYVSLRIDPSPPHAVYAVGAQRLYRSGDQGSTWQALTDLPPDTRDFQLDPFPGGARYALSERGTLYEMFE